MLIRAPDLSAFSNLLITSLFLGMLRVPGRLYTNRIVFLEEANCQRRFRFLMSTLIPDFKNRRRRRNGRVTACVPKSISKRGVPDWCERT
jgi:hypothetical protein